MKSGAKRALLTSVMVGLAFAAAACREDEQQRPMVKQKGVYEGQADEVLSDESVEELKSRARGQKF